MNDQPPKPPAKTNYLRIALFVVLAYLVVALLYDLYVVRPGMKTTQVALEEEIEKQNSAPQETVIFGPDDVHKKLGREPVGDLVPYKGYLYEEFAWPTALPGRTHRLTVVYMPTKTEPRLVQVMLFTPPEQGIDEIHEAPDQTVNATVPTAPLETGDEGKAAKASADKSKSGEEGSGEKSDAKGDSKSDTVKPSGEEKPADKPAETKEEKKDEKDYQPDAAPKAENAPAEK